MSSTASTILDPQTAPSASAVSVVPTAAPGVADVTGVVVIPRPRTAPEQVTELAGGQACRCGHGAEAHEHFRSGSDCSACGCATYRTTPTRASIGRAAMLVTVLVRGRR